ncbi:MAG TPA: hypothetical protein VJ894_01185 [Cryomorphaceae bacterium]|nr:hypothetical protein [Cryomorphaceae bacterium]
MKYSIKVLLGLIILGMSFTACDDDDNDDDGPTTPAPTPVANTAFPPDSLFISIATDNEGDAEIFDPAIGAPVTGGLDATEISYSYDPVVDSLYFMVDVVDMAPFSDSPSIDFNFTLPNGTDGGQGLAPPFRGSQSHKTATLYADNGGTAPSDYTYTNVAEFAGNGITFTENLPTFTSICNNCITIKVDVANNKIYCGMDRNSVITDSEVGATNTATITLSSNVGYQRGNNDLTTDGSTFTITIQ